MKYLASLILFFLLSFPAHACEIHYETANRDIIHVLTDSGWDFNNYDLLCSRLQIEGAGLFLAGGTIIAQGKSVGWAFAVLKDKDSNIIASSGAGSSTQVSGVASSFEEMRALYLAVNAAVHNIDISTAFRSLEQEVMKAKGRR